ncbi:MAG: BamA/TamA family outer membrane protein [Bacteroidales bacterium]|nr:BamA/TamA family outer membrane protein [Bacteroidales bacterium]MBN2749903.1 BamA/TamA family outer membrane protein [Bacteroidales bacterium]
MLVVACSGTKHLPPGEKLYTGAKIKIKSSSDVDKKDKRLAKAVAKDALRPNPNKSFLGMRFRLWKYMVFGENPKTKFGKWVKSSGEPPVLLSDLKPNITSSIIDSKLFNFGFFKSYTDFKLIEKRRTAQVVYTCYVHNPFKISVFAHAVTNDTLSEILLVNRKNSLVKPGDTYRLDVLKKERERIDVLLKDRGYFYFNPDYLIFKADTSAVNKTVSLILALKDSVPQRALTVYRINRVFIDQQYRLSQIARGKNGDTTQFGGYLFRGKQSDMNIKPWVIVQSVFLRKNETYSRQNHTLTLNHLMSLGTNKFVQVKFSDSDTAAHGFLDVEILMTTMTNYNFRAEMDVVTKSNNFTGPRMNVSLLNRNTFRGAELLSLSLAGSYEAQLSRSAQNLYSYSLSPQVDLVFPRFIVPFGIRDRRSIYVPKTKVSLSYSYLKRVSYFGMQTLQAGFGYKWRETLLKEHEFNPISLSYTSLRNQSAEFTELLASNPFLKKSYNEQFIGGCSYSFTYNEQVLPLKRIQFYFHVTGETAGNLFTLTKIVSGEKPTSKNPSTLLGSVYSQYAKLSVDTRTYINFRHKNRLAVRFFLGVASPYGNSSVLPYNKQFFSGGSNSLRAFQINSVGPGTYNQNADSIIFMQLGGNIKLELNVESRFTIYRFLKGALFVDMGNIWMQKSSPACIGEPFLAKAFISELAIGAGVGIRFDVSFFLLRFDLAMPLKKPWLDKGKRWVIDEINFGSSEWRTNNLILNVAIGYPF